MQTASIFHRVLGRLAPSAFFRNVLLLMSGTAAAQLVTVASMPVLSRLYDPATFGALSVFLAVVTFFVPLSTLKYDLAIILPKDDAEAANILVLTCLIALAASLLTIPVVLLAVANLNLETMGVSNLALLVAVPTLVLLRGTTDALYSWETRHKRFKRISLIELLRSSSSALLQILAGLAELAVNGLIFGRLIGRQLTTLLLGYYTIREEGRFVLENFKKDKMLALAKKYRDFPKFHSPRAFLNQFPAHVMPFLLAYAFDPAVAGLFWVSFRLLQMPVNVIGGALHRVFYQRAAEIYGDNGSLKRLFGRTTLFLSIMSVGPTVIILLFGPALFSFFLGAAWEKAGLYSQWLILGWFAQFVNIPSYMLVPILNLQGLAFKIDAIKVVLQGASVSLAALYGSDTLAIAAFSIVTFGANTFLSCFMILKIRQYERNLCKDGLAQPSPEGGVT